MTVGQHIQAMFGQDIFCVPKNATNTIYVEGIPVDATEREVSRKCAQSIMLNRPLSLHLYLICSLSSSIYVDIFRPFKGFKSVRLIPREINPDEKVILCFADFESNF